MTQSNLKAGVESSDKMLALETDPLPAEQLQGIVEQELRAIPFIDIHTHLYRPSLGRLGLWGIDELLTYHYLEAELFRSSLVTPDQYWAMTKPEKADAIWRALFVQNLPISEATRGVVAVLKAFDLPTYSTDLSEARAFFADQQVESHIQNVFGLAGISEAVMTNDPLDEQEAELWKQGPAGDTAFHAAIRLDGLLNGWSDSWQLLQAQGYQVDAQFSGKSAREVRRFVDHWSRTMKPVYMAVSLPDSFQFPEDSVRARLLEQVVLPACQEQGIPLSLMIGVRRKVNPAIRLAGDGAGRADLRSLEHLCREFPKKPIFSERAQPRESVRALRLCTEVCESAAVWLLVVPEQSFDCGRDHAGADRDAGLELHTAAFGRTRTGTSSLQVAQHTANACADSDEHL